MVIWGSGVFLLKDVERFFIGVNERAVARQSLDGAFHIEVA